jgi:hypothetical protein
LDRVEDAHRLPRRQPLEIGDPDLDHEAAAGLEMRGDALEAGDLRRLRGLDRAWMTLWVIRR